MTIIENSPSSSSAQNPSPAQQPLVSVIMPAYNAGRFIADAIESVLCQSYANLELIIVNDASSDNTADVVRRFTDPRIRFIDSPRIGSPAGVRNTALKVAQGDFISFLDADDLYFPYALKKLIRPLLDNPRLSAIYGYPLDMDENGQSLPPAVTLIPKPDSGLKNDHILGDYDGEQESPYIVPAMHHHSWENIIASKSNCQLPSIMLRRTAMDGIGLFNEILGGVEDYEFYLRLYLYDYDGVANIPDYVYRYRIYTASLTKSPEHCWQILDSCVVILDWLFKHPSLPAEALPMRSMGYVFAYRYLARERLLYGQPQLCRELIHQAMRDPNITMADRVRECVPLYIRSLLPTGFDGQMVRYKRQFRHLMTSFKRVKPFTSLSPQQTYEETRA